jgi:hypothetical protein
MACHDAFGERFSQIIDRVALVQASQRGRFRHMAIVIKANRMALRTVLLNKRFALDHITNGICACAAGCRQANRQQAAAINANRCL